MIRRPQPTAGGARARRSVASSLRKPTFRQLVQKLTSDSGRSLKPAKTVSCMVFCRGRKLWRLCGGSGPSMKETMPVLSSHSLSTAPQRPSQASWPR